MDGKKLKRSGRETLKTLQVAVGRQDKENLTRKAVPKKKPTMKGAKSESEKKIDLKKNVDLKNSLNKTKSATLTRAQLESGKSAVIAEDLTSDNISENYWKNLAESRRVALDIALVENQQLHNKVTELEYETSELKKMLDDAKSLVQVLTEMLEEGENQTEDVQDSHDEQNSSVADSEGDLNDVSFRSCL